MLKKIIIFVPHQDDEINLVGNILDELAEHYSVYIVYSSLEMDSKKAETRKKEAMNSCMLYGIDSNHIKFLGFPDTPNSSGKHYFTDGDVEIVNKIYEVIESIKPDIIIGTDFDFHSDHRMLSLALDEALCKNLKRYADYKPIYLKGFCYETAYYGVEDYSASALENTKVKDSMLSNVSYRWEDRLSISNNHKNCFIFQQKAFKALKCHKSQYALLHARSVINSDNVFWQKRTDNLLLNNCHITASSGDVNKLCDLKVIDTNDIITVDPKKIDYTKGLWIPDKNDLNPIINIQFDSGMNIHQIVLYGSPMIEEDRDCNIKIFINGKIFIVDRLNSFGQSTILNVGNIKCNNIKIVDYSSTSLSQIEVFNQENKQIEILKQTVRCKKDKDKLIDSFDMYIFNVIKLLVKIRRKIDVISNQFKK